MRSRQFEVKYGVCDLGHPVLINSDIVVMHRQFDPLWLNIMDMGHKKGCKYVFEIDDDIFHIPEGFYNRKNIMTQIQGMIPIIEKSDAVIVSTEPLAEAFKKLNKKVFVLPNFIAEPKNSIPERNGKVRIGWSGSASHSIDFENYIKNALQEIQNIYKDKVSIIFHNWIPDDLVGKVSFFKFVQPMDFMEFLRNLSFDIGIIPCRINQFNHARSNLKYLEYSINRTATIASPVCPYVKTISDSAGIIARNEYNTWLDALKKLIDDEDYRKTIALNAYAFVRGNYMLHDHISTIKSIFTEISEG